jgi:hypothetical protein
MECRVSERGIRCAGRCEGARREKSIHWRSGRTQANLSRRAMEWQVCEGSLSFTLVTKSAALDG